VEVGNWQGAWGRGRERGSGGRERGGERASGTLPLGARFGVRTGEGEDGSATLLYLAKINAKISSKYMKDARNLQVSVLNKIQNVKACWS
jgi:hypothetical protein